MNVVPGPSMAGEVVWNLGLLEGVFGYIMTLIWILDIFFIYAQLNTSWTIVIPLPMGAFPRLLCGMHRLADKPFFHGYKATFLFLHAGTLEEGSFPYVSGLSWSSSLTAVNCALFAVDLYCIAGVWHPSHL